MGPSPGHPQAAPSPLQPAVIDLYCERLGPGLWAEPLNAVTNIAFLLAAWRLATLARRGGPGGDGAAGADRGLLGLAGLALALAIGSGLFHTIATPWALAADVLPILLFQLLVLSLWLRRRLALEPLAVVASCGLFLLASLLGRSLPGLFNGSLAYAPTLAVLALLAWHDRRSGQGNALQVATAVFAVSLLLRSLDNTLCGWWPLGTHLFWHLLNAEVLVLSGRALLQSDGPGLDNAPSARRRP